MHLCVCYPKPERTGNGDFGNPDLFFRQFWTLHQHMFIKLFAGGRAIHAGIYHWIAAGVGDLCDFGIPFAGLFPACGYLVGDAADRRSDGIGCAILFSSKKIVFIADSY